MRALEVDILEVWTHEGVLWRVWVAEGHMDQPGSGYLEGGGGWCGWARGLGGGSTTTSTKLCPGGASSPCFMFINSYVSSTDLRFSLFMRWLSLMLFFEFILIS